MTRSLLLTALLSAQATGLCQAEEDDAPPRAFQTIVRVTVDPEAISFDDGSLDPAEATDSTNVYFSSVQSRNTRDLNSLEVSKQLVMAGAGASNTLGSGWRLDGYSGGAAVSVGEEVRGLWGVSDAALERVPPGWRRSLLESVRFTPYGVVGLRAMNLEDDYRFDGFGSILAGTRVETTSDNYVIGPQLGVGLACEASMFRLEAVLLGLVGYGESDLNQSSIFGEDLIPGALNRPASARVQANHADPERDTHVAWHGESRVTASCQLTQRLRFDATWRGVVSGPVVDSAASTLWNAPDFGINAQSGTVDWSNWFLGLTYTR